MWLLSEVLGQLKMANQGDVFNSSYLGAVAYLLLPVFHCGVLSVNSVVLCDFEQLLYKVTQGQFVAGCKN